MKTISANKCKDGWVIEVIDRIAVSDEIDVLKVIRENGLKVNAQCSHKPTEDNPNEFIYAD